MLKIDLPIQGILENIVAPATAIEGVELENNNYKVYYSVYDDNNTWVGDQYILEEVKIYATDGLSVQSKLLKELVQKPYKDNKIIDYFEFFNTSSNVQITTWCGTSDFSGSKTSLDVLLNGSIINSVYQNTTYSYINKIKNLNLLNLTASFNTASNVDTQYNFNTELLVNDNPQKKCGLGFVFDLENFLSAYSKEFRILKNNKFYKDFILANTKIDTANSAFFKNNISSKEKEPIRIKGDINVLSFDNINKKHFITILDDNLDKNNYSYYNVSVKLVINDYSKKFASINIKNKLTEAINFLLNYKNAFEIFDLKATNPYTNVFTNGEYESRIEKIKIIINNLSNISSLFFNKPIQDFISLFVSILHPLTTTLDLLDRLITFVKYLYNLVSNIISYNTEGTFIEASNEDFIVFEKIFNKNNENIQSADFNYNFDYGYGLEVLTANPQNLRLSEGAVPFKEIFPTELAARRTLEHKKYYKSNISNTGSYQHLSLSYIDLGNKSYNLIVGLPEANTKIFNDIFIDLRQYNNDELVIKQPESYVLALLGQSINIKSITNRNNSSTNNLVKYTLFDNNRDTKQKSLKYVADTGANNLFLYLDNTSFIEPDSIINENENKENIQQVNGTIGSSTDSDYIFKYSKENINNIELKPKTFIYYNNFYKLILNPNLSSDLFDIYELKETAVNEIFNKKLRLMNRYFIVRKAPQTIITSNVPIIDLDTDLKLNIPAIYFSNKFEDYKVNLTVEQI